MTRAQIIKLVQQDTGGVRDNTMDWNAKFAQVLQEFCAEHRFSWRKKYLSFPTVAGIGEYDLASIGTETPSGAGAFVDEITKITRRTDSTTVDEVDPVTDDAAIQMYVNDTTTSDKPTIWMPDPRDLSASAKIILRPVPNAVYTMYVSFWAMPSPAFDSDDETIYIVPPSLHHVIQTALEKEVWRLSFGVKDDRYVTAQNEYLRKVSLAKLKPSLDGAKTPQFKNTGNEAIQSTR